MAITDAGTNLTQTWTEQPTVTFTAGTLADMTACQTEVQTNIQRGTLSGSTTPTSTQVETWLIRAKQELCERFGFTFKRRYATASISVDAWRIALPPDYDGGEVRMRDTTNDDWMHYIDPLLFDAKYPNPSSESKRTPGDAYFTIKNMEVWLSHPCDGTTTLEIEYERSADDNTANDVSYLPQLMRFKIVDYATYRAFLVLQQFTAAQMYRGEWEAGMVHTKKADGRKRWAAGGFRCHNWF